jgi:hypothetical protein
MKKLLSIIAVVFAFSTSYGQNCPLTVNNNIPADLNLMWYAGKTSNCGTSNVATHLATMGTSTVTSLGLPSEEWAGIHIQHIVGYGPADDVHPRPAYVLCPGFTGTTSYFTVTWSPNGCVVTIN